MKSSSLSYTVDTAYITMNILIIIYKYISDIFGMHDRLHGGKVRKIWIREGAGRGKEAYWFMVYIDKMYSHLWPI